MTTFLDELPEVWAAAVPANAADAAKRSRRLIMWVVL
jgi:hypothetical protein